MLSRIREDVETVPKTIGYKITQGLAILSDEEGACTNPQWAYRFTLYIPGADIEKCQEAACKNSYWTYRFAIEIPKADVARCRKACDGTKYSF